MTVHRSGLRTGEAERELPLDDLLPDAEIVIDRAATLAATPEPSYQWLEVGEHILDWGPGWPTLEAAVIDPPRDLGFRSTRGRTPITWVDR